MEFNQKLQELRRQRGLTQEELAAKLYVSRTAISKWESGRGYPSIDSLKAIAAFFSVTVDQLLSSDEILTVAAEEGKQRAGRLRDLAFGLVDLCMALLWFLPLLAGRGEETVRSVSLLSLDGMPVYVTAGYIAVVAGTVLWGILTLALQGFGWTAWVKCKVGVSLVLGAVAVLLFTVSLQPYAAVFALALLAVKVFLLMQRR